MTVKLTFAIDLQSDYHVSAGHGLAAEADSALLRDVDGAPVLRGTTLTGLLRDGLWRLMQLEPLREMQMCQASGKPKQEENGRIPPEYCGQFDPDAEDCPVCRLFGTPRHPKRWRVHSARPENRLAVESGAAIPAETRQIVHRVRIDPVTRRAKPRALFSQEDGSSGLSFVFTVMCLANDAAALDEAALLVAAARFVRQLGRSRRRGQGECLFSLRKAEGVASCPTAGQAAQEFLLDHFEKRWLDGNQVATTGATAAYAPDANGDGTRFRLVIRADEPLLLARRAEAGNQFESLAYIPGTAVRGALAGMAVQRHALKGSGSPNGAVYDDFADIFLHGGIHFPTLYPAQYRNRHIYPAIPAPLDLLTCKVFPGFSSEGGHGVIQATASLEQKCPECGEHLQRLDGFVTLQLSRSRLEQERRHEIHIRIQPESSRVAPGDLYTYVAIEAGRFFVGELTAQEVDAWSRFCALIGQKESEPFSFYIGKASRRGYGRVTAWIEPLDKKGEGEPAPHTWIQLPLAERIQEDDDVITLTLLTDAIVPDKWGRYPAGFESGWLGEWLGFPVEIIDAFARVRPIDSFNAHLGLPRWQDIALTAGSTVYIKKPDDWRKHLVEAEKKGIGLRREEGFGRIAFNHPVYRPDGTIRRSAIKLPDALWLAGSVTESAFREEWGEMLRQEEEKLRKLCGQAPFTAVARWLYTNQDASPAVLKGQLENLGVPDSNLIKAVGKQEYGARDKPNRLIEKKERLQSAELPDEERRKEGLGLLYTLLEQLESEDKAYWPAGIVMLADQVAAVASADEGEG